MTVPSLIILAAGEGKRIKPIVTSKALLPFLGKTLLERVVDSVRSLNFNRVVIVVNPQDKNRVVGLFPGADVVVQEKPTGMAGAIAATGTVLEGPAAVINGDDWVDEKILRKFAGEIKTNPAKAAVTGIKSKKGLSGGYFRLQGQSLKVAEKQGGGEWFKLVLDYFPDIKKFTGLLSATNSARDDVYEQALNRLDLTLVKAEGSFYQLKYPHQILDLTAGLLTGKNQVAKTARVMGGSEVINSYLGPGVVIGQNCLVRDSVIEQNTVVGFGTEIARSYIGPGNWFHRNYIGDSVIEGGSNFGAGAVTANYRFDHKNIADSGRNKFGAVVGRGAQIGVNASLMPGVLIAAGSIVWPAEVKR